MPKKKMEEEIIKTTLRVPRDVWKSAKVAAVQADMSLSDFIIRALEDAVKKAGAR